MAASPTSRTLKLLRDDGWTAAVVEKWNPHAKIRQDLFGIIDVLAVKEGLTLAVQCTSYSNFSDRMKKIQESEATPSLIQSGWIIEVHGWHKKKNRWQVRRSSAP